MCSLLQCTVGHWDKSADHGFLRPHWRRHESVPVAWPPYLCVRGLRRLGQTVGHQGQHVPADLHRPRVGHQRHLCEYEWPNCKLIYLCIIHTVFFLLSSVITEFKDVLHQCIHIQYTCQGNHYSAWGNCCILYSEALKELCQVIKTVLHLKSRTGFERLLQIWTKFIVSLPWKHTIFSEIINKIKKGNNSK